MAWIALVITEIVGGLGLAFQQPWLFPSLGPTIFIHTVTPNQEAATPWNTFVGHAIGGAAAFLSLWIFGALHSPSAMVGGELTLPRVAASALAVALTIGMQIPVRAGHAPAAATTLSHHAGGPEVRLRDGGRSGGGYRPCHLPLRLWTTACDLRVPPGLGMLS